LRKEKRYSCQHLSNKIKQHGGKLTRQHLSLIENGKVEPTLKTLLSIANCLDVSIDVFF